MNTLLLVIVCYATLSCMAIADVAPQLTKFKAAVYGHSVIMPPAGPASREQALQYMKRNLEVFGVQAAEAKKQGADILVFPEDGIYGMRFSRSSIYNYLENIPQPLNPEWSPCVNPQRHQDTEVLQELSCIAKNNSLYIVANMGDKQPCDPKTDPKCPNDGRYQFNTNVAFAPNGTILAKYHKYNLFYEKQFDTPELEIVHFDTPFGRFGLMICFDVLFAEPVVPIVLEKNISNLIFAAAWMDALPLLSAIGFHSSIARGLGVNFLAADIHIPFIRMQGSGIYSADGMKAFHYNSTSGSSPKLLVAELDVLDKPKPNIEILQSNINLDFTELNCQKTEEDNPSLLDDEFISDLFYDKFTFRALNKAMDVIKVCQKDVCCTLDYAIVGEKFNEDLYAFGAFDGLHTYEGQYYFQICTVVKCADSTDRQTCGAVTDTSSTVFRKLLIQGQMTTHFVYPQVVLSDGQGELLLAEAETWTFHNSTLNTTSTSFTKPLLSAALFGRDYKRDNCVENLGAGNGCSNLGTFYIYFILQYLWQQLLCGLWLHSGCPT